MWKIKEMMKCFLAPTFLRLGGNWSPLTPQRRSSKCDHASNIPSLKSSSRFPRQYCGPIQTDGLLPTDGDSGDPGGSCENRRGQLNNHQATDEAVTPGPGSGLSVISYRRRYQCPMNGPHNHTDTAHSFRPVPGSGITSGHGTNQKKVCTFITMAVLTNCCSYYWQAMRDASRDLDKLLSCSSHSLSVVN